MTVSKQFVLFLAVSGFAAVVNIASRPALGLLMSFEISVLLAYLFGLTTAFTLNRALVFRAKHGSVRSQYLRFTIVNAFSLAQVWIVSVSLARWLFPFVGFIWHAETIAHVIGVISPAWTSYIAHKYYSFRIKSNVV